MRSISARDISSAWERRQAPAATEPCHRSRSRRGSRQTCPRWRPRRRASCRVQGAAAGCGCRRARRATPRLLPRRSDHRRRQQPKALHGFVGYHARRVTGVRGVVDPVPRPELVLVPVDGDDDAPVEDQRELLAEVAERALVALAARLVPGVERGEGPVVDLTREYRVLLARPRVDAKLVAVRGPDQPRAARALLGEECRDVDPELRRDQLERGQRRNRSPGLDLRQITGGQSAVRRGVAPESASVRDASR